jgi:hypothetical protein
MFKNQKDNRTFTTGEQNSSSSDDELVNECFALAIMRGSQQAKKNRLRRERRKQLKMQAAMSAPLPPFEGEPIEPGTKFVTSFENGKTIEQTIADMDSIHLAQADEARERYCQFTEEQLLKAQQHQTNADLLEQAIAIRARLRKPKSIVTDYERRILESAKRRDLLQDYKEWMTCFKWDNPTDFGNPLENPRIIGKEAIDRINGLLNSGKSCDDIFQYCRSFVTQRGRDDPEPDYPYQWPDGSLVLGPGVKNAKNRKTINGNMHINIDFNVKHSFDFEALLNQVKNNLFPDAKLPIDGIVGVVAQLYIIYQSLNRPDIVMCALTTIAALCGFASKGALLLASIIGKAVECLKNPPKMHAGSEDEVLEMNASGVFDFLPYIGGLVSVVLTGFLLHKLPGKGSIDELMARMRNLPKTVESTTQIGEYGTKWSETILDGIRSNVLGHNFKRLDIWGGIKEWETEVRDMTRLSSSVEIKTSASAQARADSLYQRGLVIARELDNLRIPGNAQSSFRTHLMAAMEIHKKAHCSGAGYSMPRKEPLVAQFFGPSGVGKSALVNMLCADVLRSDGMTNSSQIRDAQYSRKVGQEFWDGFTSNHKVVIYDDFGQLKDSAQKPNEEFLELIHACNTAPYAVHMANLGDKASTFFQANLILLTSNQDTWNVRSLTHPEAIERRLELRIAVSVKEEFGYPAMENGVRVTRLDRSKINLNDKVNFSFLDAYNFDIVDPTDLESPPQKFAHRGLHYDQMIKILLTQYHVKKAHGAKLIETMDAYASRPMNNESYAHLYGNMTTYDPSYGSGESFATDPKQVFHVGTPEQAVAAMKNAMDQAKKQKGYHYFAADWFRNLLGRQSYSNCVHLTWKELFFYPSRHIDRKIKVESNLPSTSTAEQQYLTTSEVIQNLVEICAVPMHARNSQWIKDLWNSKCFTIYYENDFQYAEKLDNMAFCRHFALFPSPEIKAHPILARLDSEALFECLMWLCAHQCTPEFQTRNREPEDIYLTAQACQCSNFANTWKPDVGVASEAAFQRFLQDAEEEQRRQLGITTEDYKTAGFMIMIMGAVMMVIAGFFFVKLIKRILTFIRDLFSSEKKEDEKKPSHVISGDLEHYAAELNGKKKLLRPMVTTKAMEKKELRTEIEGTLTTVIDQNSATLVGKILFGNMYKIECPHMDEEGNLVWIHTNNLMFVKGRIAVTNRHFLVFCMEKEFGMLRLRSNTCQDGMIFHVSDLQFTFPPQEAEDDLGLVAFPRTIRQHADLTAHLSLEKDLDSLSEIKKMLVVGYLPTDRIMNMVHTTMNARGIDVTMITPKPGTLVNEQIRTRVRYSYPIESAYGECGAIALSSEPHHVRKIIGLHCAGSTNPQACGFSVPLTLERFNHLVSYLKLDLDSEMSPVPFVHKEPEFEFRTCSASPFFEKGVERARVFEAGCEFATVHLKSEVMGRNFSPCGIVTDGVTAPGKSDFMPSPIHGLITEPTTAPAKLRPFTNPKGERVNPEILARKKADMPTMSVGKNVLAMCVDDVEQMIEEFDTTENYKQVFSHQVAIEGIPGDEFVAPLNRKSSPGYPWQKKNVNMLGAPMKGKHKWLSINGDPEQGYCFDNAELLSECTKRIHAGECGERYPTTWVDTLKDERRPLDRVYAGKTRQFNVGPIDFNVVFRRFFLGFIAMMMSHRIDLESCVGVNPYSKDWDRVKHKVTSRGKKIIAGDFSNFDGTLNAEILWAICDLINNWYDDGEDNASVRISLWSEIVHSIHQSGGNVYTWNHSQPSGNPATVIINSLYNSIAVRMAYVYAADHAGKTEYIAMTEFNKHVSQCNYGDDNLINFSDEISDWFNMDTIVFAFTRLGMTYTDEEKSVGGDKWRTIQDVSFLKRKFRWDATQNRNRAPLSLKTVLEMAMWVRGKNDHHQLTHDTMQMAVYELSQHHREVFEEWVPIFKQAAKDADLNPFPRFESYDTYQRLDGAKYLGMSFLCPYIGTEEPGDGSPHLVLKATE